MASQSYCVSSPITRIFSRYSFSDNNKNGLFVINNSVQRQQNCFFTSSNLVSRVPASRGFASLSFDPLLRYPIKSNEAMAKRKGKRFGAVCHSGPLHKHTLQWISAISSLVLTFIGGTAIRKAFLVPLFALQAPANVVSWIKSEYGIWAAFLALLLRLFFYIPGELELPFMAMLLVIVAPSQVLKLRGTQQGAIIGLAIAAYLAFQHFYRTGNMHRAFEQGSVVASLAIICLTVVSCLLLI